MIAEQIRKITSQLPSGTRLVAISKYHPSDAIIEAYEAGQRIFGESHVQELQQKHSSLPSDIEWHFIGHLQTNKVKYIAPYISLVHAVDSPRLLAELEKQATRYGHTIKALLQLHVAQEETKFGFTPDECQSFLQQGTWRDLTHVAIAGVMSMASNTDDQAQIRREFRLTHDFFTSAQQEFFASSNRAPENQEEAPCFTECSMGMSHDWQIAVEEGSTLVRIGTSIFGEREY